MQDHVLNLIACASAQGYCSEEQREEALVSQRLRSMDTDLTAVWSGTLYMPEELFAEATTENAEGPVTSGS